MNILIAEDEQRLRRLMKDYLKRENYTIYEAENGEEAVEIFYNEKIDLAILDIMMPKLDGWQVAKNIRGISEIPIIILTAKSEEEDQLKGYDIGADEYVTKPFSPKILVAKVKALVNRVGKKIEIKEYKEIKIDMKSHKVYFKKEEINLTPKEYELLLVLVQNEGIALERNTLLDKVWGYNYFGDLRTVDTHIKRLRKKMKVDYIQTVRGIGYRFEVN